jgi:hypothetical protein
MLSGDPGSGKTWVALAIAAALSQGRIPATPAAKATREPCTILYASTHNGGADLIRPRFASLNGDPARLACQTRYSPKHLRRAGKIKI